VNESVSDVAGASLASATEAAASEARGAPAWFVPVLSGLFLLSGFSALVYQVLWLRLLGLVFGVTVQAASVVLASFMAGLALGSVAAGRLADRVRRPLVWFAGAEASIALAALASPIALDGLQRVYTALSPAMPGQWVLAAVRFACSFGVLLMPTALMGSTLPLVVRSSLAREGGLGERLSLLYGANTAGAIAGSLVAGYVLIGTVGIAGSFRAAALVNVCVSAAALLISWMLAGAHGTTGRSTPARQSEARVDVYDFQTGEDITERQRALVLLVFALSGFASLALEVIWLRILVLFLPGTVYAFTTIVATFLGGIAAGSYLVMPLMRRRHGIALLAALEMGIGIVSLLSLTFLAFSSEAGGPTSGTVQVSIVALLPATILLGMAFPLGLRIYAEGRTGAAADVGTRIGRFYALNVCGAILGSIVAGFVLLPVLGSRASLLAVGAISLASGLLLAGSLPRERRSLAGALAAAGIVTFLVAASSVPDPFVAAQNRRYRGERLFWREEGVQTSVAVAVRPTGGYVLYLDGLHQANDSPEMVLVHSQIGQLPMAIHPDPQRALVIGLGGGVTAGAVARHDGATVDIVELSAAVARGAEWFRHVNGDVTRRPNVHLRIDDGRNFLLLTGNRYDVVTADVIQPIHAGAGNVYSIEYFQLARSRLDEDGLMLQWIGQRPQTQYKLIMRTFLRVFPDATLWVDGSLMVGSVRPLRLDRAAFARKLEQPATRDALASIGLSSFDALAGLYTAGPDEMRAFVGEGPVLTDDRPLVEYHRSLPSADQPLDLSGLHGDVSRHISE
jgi:spermidine synthase